MNEPTKDTRSMKEIASALKAEGMACNCDLDSWEPEPSSGHTHVCRIHRQAWNMKFAPHNLPRIQGIQGS